MAADDDDQFLEFSPNKLNSLSNANKRNLGDFKYKADPRVRSRGAAHTYNNKAQLKDLAERTVQLVPVRLDLEVEGVKLRDQFTWNLNETLITPEHFAQLLADDFDSPYASQFVPLVAEEIRRQVQNYGAAVEEDPSADGAPRIKDDESDESSYGEIRIVITLDLHVGALHLRDKFEWPLFSTSSLTPEDFAKQLAADLGVGGEFVPVIAHAVREQVCFARMNWDDATQAPAFRDRPFRPENVEDDWEPELRELSEQEIERILREKERNTRYVLLRPYAWLSLLMYVSLSRRRSILIMLCLHVPDAYVASTDQRWGGVQPRLHISDRKLPKQDTEIDLRGLSIPCTPATTDLPHSAAQLCRWVKRSRLVRPAHLHPGVIHNYNSNNSNHNAPPSNTNSPSRNKHRSPFPLRNTYHTLTPSRLPRCNRRPSQRLPPCQRLPRLLLT